MQKLCLYECATWRLQGERSGRQEWNLGKPARMNQLAATAGALTIATGFSDSIGIDTVGSICTFVMTDVIWRLALEALAAVGLAATLQAGLVPASPLLGLCDGESVALGGDFEFRARGRT